MQPSPPRINRGDLRTHAPLLLLLLLTAVALTGCTRTVEPIGVLDDYAAFNCINEPDVKLRVGGWQDYTVDPLYLTRAQIREYHDDGRAIPIPESFGLTEEKIQPTLFIVPEPIWATPYDEFDDTDRDEILFTVRERMYRYLLRAYPHPVRVRYAMPLDDPMLTDHRVLTVRTYVTDVEDGQGFWRYVIGYGAGATVIQLEGRIYEGVEDETVLAEFAIRESHGGYPNGFFNPQVFDAPYCLKYAVEEAIGKLTERLREFIPGVLPRPGMEREVRQLLEQNYPDYKPTVYDGSE
ncbi:DUF4410 domain-containing protein [bacterium]|nr:DUF4410 domain-containing protein [bacterium]